MEKDTSFESGEAALLPYTAPELFVYNNAEITRGGANGPRAADFLCTGATNYKIS